ncbi:hypothetical protein L6452_26092 [Arctium lappa]|uniref:Uncharacterized protein n=1 Tax=Arctium lappa TaxID=4217 RepID=A0ACB9ACY8_ARCLA|nr:hypothetical protein L6452_26092 [Arctium lappa]
MESDNKSGGAAGDGRLLVDESSWDVQSDRKRFQIDLEQGETTIVSWTKLLRDAGIPVDHSPPPSPQPPKRFHQEDESRSECSNIILKKKDEQKNLPQKLRTAISEVLEGIKAVQSTKNTKMGHARVKSTTEQNYDNRKQTILSASVTSSMKDPSDTGIKSGSPSGMTLDQAAIRAELQSITLTSHISEEHSLNNGRVKLPDLNVPYTVQAASTSPMHIKEESGGKVNGSMLEVESTILEMETMVAKSRRLHGDVQDADHSVASKCRLPQELKQKLETVARLAHSSQGRISDELIMRLMSILGHWLKPRTLKRCLRNMIPADLSSCGGDAIRFSQIKKEVVEMIRLRTLPMETKDRSSNKTMELPAAYKTKYNMDHEMEDKICDFYDIYVQQGMEEIKSSEIRNFYIQLAALWPKGTMDNHGIQNAICRAKERRRTLLQEKVHKKGKRKKSSTAVIDEDLHGETYLVADLKRPVNDTNAPVLAFPATGTPELDQNLGAAAKGSAHRQQATARICS